MKSECMRIQNLFKHLRRSVFAQTVNGLKSLTGHAKTLHLRCLKGVLNMLLLKSKASARTLHAANQNVNVRDICFNTFLANV